MIKIKNFQPRGEIKKVHKIQRPKATFVKSNTGKPLGPEIRSCMGLTYSETTERKRRPGLHAFHDPGTL